ncbi:MAG: AbrB/MazE/SpoVT family DNA-binding domain-containing protein [Thermoproteota archaeon]
MPYKIKVTKRYPTTIPAEMRKEARIKSGQEVNWYITKRMTILEVSNKIENPVEFLTSQTKLDLDATQLVRESRDL